MPVVYPSLQDALAEMTDFVNALRRKGFSDFDIAEMFNLPFAYDPKGKCNHTSRLLSWIERIPTTGAR